MSEIIELIKSLKGKCSCGLYHDTAIQDIRIDSGLVRQVGMILKESSFSLNLLLVADKNTLKAADGIMNSLHGFKVYTHLYDNLRVAEMKHVDEIETLIVGKDISVLSVGSGSVNDICRLAAARQHKKLCIFATAPSMDGFASYSSPIVVNGFKASFAAKSPEVLIGDTKILANAPTTLKSAGFGDMIAKYVALVDWKISHVLTGEIYCERVAKLTRNAVDKLMVMSDRVNVNDEETAGKIFEALLKTGIGMSFMQNSRPASGSEHIISHLIECKELQNGIVPNYHGDDIGVCTLEMLKYYRLLAQKEQICAKKEQVDWQEVFDFYGDMAGDIKKLNFPENVIDVITPEALESHWQEIRAIIDSVPTFEDCEAAMRKAGCKLTVSDIGKEQKFFDECVKYSPYMRKRVTLLRLKDMIE